MSDTSDDMEALAAQYEDRWLSEKENQTKNKMEVTGVIKMIGTTQKVSDSFQKRDIVVTTQEQYPQDLLIQFVQDKCSVLDQYKVGEQVTVDINLRGREWVNPKDGEVKYFNTIQGWKIGYSGQHAAAIEGTKHEAEIWNPNDDEYQLPF